MLDKQSIWTELTRRRLPAKLAAENLRCAELEGKREAQLLREAEAEARRRRIERCDYELARLAEDTQDKAYLIALAVRDWQAERDLLERDGQEKAKGAGANQ